MTETDTPAPEGYDSFEAFFAAEIAPGLPALEAERRDRVRKAYTRAVGGAFVVVVGALIAWLSVHIAAGLAVLIAGAVLGLLWVRRPASRHRAAVRAFVIPPLLRYLGSGSGGVEYHREPGDRFDLALVRRAGIVAPFTRAKLEDLFVGRYRDTDFRLVEARLTRKRETGSDKDGSRERRRTVYAGLLCEVSVPVPFSGVTLLVGDKGALGNWLGDVMKRNFAGIAAVSLDHPAFEARYQVYSDDPVEARRLLQPGLMESLLALADELDAQAVNCAFIEGRFLLAIPQRRDLFEIGRLHRSLDNAEEDLRRLAAEFTIPQRLIDTLHGERKQVLPQS